MFESEDDVVGGGSDGVGGVVPDGADGQVEEGHECLREVVGEFGG